MSGCRTGKTNKDAGFSLVELIIVVSILAIAAIPLMRSMALASRTNAKAQSIQNATSLAESVMEEIKATPVDTLKSVYGDDFNASGIYEIKMDGGDGKGINATQGEKFIATVTIDRAKYSDDSDLTTESGKVKGANKLKLPAIEEIDTLSQAVLSAKELNKYDKDALSYFNEKIADWEHSPDATIASKTIDIIKDSTGMGTDNGVNVKASVTYIDNAGNKYVRDLYSGTFIAGKNEDNSNKTLDSNIYIFYKQGDLAETINIKDSSTPVIEVGKPTDSHKVYFVRQDSSSGPVAINFSGTAGTGSFSYSNISDLVDGDKKYGNVELITNLGTSLVAKGHIYKEESRTKLYYVTVVLTKPGDPTVYATLSSTVSASDRIETPTPTPTPVPTI